MMKTEDEIRQKIAQGDRKSALALMEREENALLDNEELLLEWGRILYAEGRRTEALNRFNAVLRLNPGNATARNYVSIINSILGYYCKDLLNP